jgi:hypothetical protein
MDVHADLHALPLVHKVVLVSLTASIGEDAALLGQGVVGKAPFGSMAGPLFYGQQAEAWGAENC